MEFNSMFNGIVELNVKLYWCELNQQIVERHPKYVSLNNLGIGGYTYNSPTKYMTYIGEL